MSWCQLNLGLARPRGPASAQDSARRVFAALRPRVEAHRAAGALAHFSFLRKAPDMRVRLHAHAPALLDEYRAVIAELTAEGALSASHTSVYEPEERLFGGPEGLAAAHGYFDADARAFMALDTLSQQGQATVPPDVLMTAVLNDLFVRALEGASEVWDTWCNVATAQGLPAQGPIIATFDLEALSPRASAGERAVLADYRRANAALARALGAAWSAGQLTSGLRAILAFVSLFSFNRHGLGPPDRARVAHTMAASWDPRREMKGSSS